MSSKLKKAHKTHALAQPAGTRYPHTASGTAGHLRSPAEDRALESFARLCELVPDPAERAALLGVGPTVDAAWGRGEGLPMLRARRKTLERTLAAVENRPPR